MSTLLGPNVRMLIICLTLSSCRAYGQEGALRSTPVVLLPMCEACIPSQIVHGAEGNVEDATVSVTSMLVFQKARRAFEHAERAFAGNKLEDVEKELNNALLIDPNSAIAWCFMGTLHERKRQPDKALWDYSQALLADSHLLAAYLGLARITVQEQRWQEVIQVTDELVRLNSVAFPVAYLYKAAAHFNLGNYAAAERNAREFQSLDTKHEWPQVYLLLGDILAREHDYAGAAEQKKIFLTIVSDADDSEEIKKQIEVLEDLIRRKENAGVPSSQDPKSGQQFRNHCLMAEPEHLEAAH